MYEENVYEAKVKKLMTEFREVAEEEHEVKLVNEYYYNFTELDLMNGKNICISNLVIGKRYGADILLNMFEEKEND